MNTKLLLAALLALFATAAQAQTVKSQTANPPMPVHADLLQAVRVHAAALRSEPIRLNSESLHPFRARPLFPDSLPPVAMTGEPREASYVGVIAGK